MIVKNPLGMSAEELERYLRERLVKKFGDIKQGTKTHTDYSELLLHDLLANISPDKKMTTNGGKFISDIKNDDHILPFGSSATVIDEQG